MFYDFDKYPLDMQHVYGGHAAQKVGVLVDGEPYMLKYPTNLKSRDIKNSELSYSNSPYSEYIGSHIYDILGMPVHETLIGQRKGKTVVACKNFCKEDERLMMFSELKTTFEPIGMHSDSITEGSDTDLQEVLQVLNEHPLLEFNRNLVKCRFWNMFVIDAYIGNPDRNNENWGLLATGENRSLAPVYDNGNCLSDKWDENKIMTFLKGSEAEKKEMAFSIPSIFTAEGKRIYPLSFIAKKENEDCNQAVLRVVDRLIKEQGRINDFINNVPGLSAKAKSFYAGVLDQRYSKGLLPVYKELYMEVHGKQFGAKAHTRGGRG